MTVTAVVVHLLIVDVCTGGLRSLGTASHREGTAQNLSSRP